MKSGSTSEPAAPARRAGCFVVADPSLVDARGHHYSLTLQVTRGALALGLEVVWWTHRDCSAAAPAGVEVCRLFSATMYDRYRPETKAKLAADPAAQLLAEIEEGIARCGLGADAIVYFHTGFGDLMRVLPRWAEGEAWRTRPVLHVCTPYDLDTMPGKDPGPAVGEALQALRMLEALDRRLFLWTETPQLATHYQRTLGVNARAMPLPPPEGADAPPARSGLPVTALYLGAAREEKGFTRLPGLAAALYDEFGRSGRLRFVIQCTPQIVGVKPPIRQAIDKLRALPAGYVELIDGVMDEADYHARMLAADVVLLLYDRRAYRIRGSGIAVEAVCAERSLLAQAGTFCASLITHGGGGAVDDDVQAAAALAALVRDPEAQRERARVQGRAYRAANDVRRYVARLLAASRLGADTVFLPSALVGFTAYPLLRSTPVAVAPWPNPMAPS